MRPALLTRENLYGYRGIWLGSLAFLGFLLLLRSIDAGFPHFLLAVGLAAVVMYEAGQPFTRRARREAFVRVAVIGLALGAVLLGEWAWWRGWSTVGTAPVGGSDDLSTAGGGLAVCQTCILGGMSGGPLGATVLWFTMLGAALLGYLVIRKYGRRRETTFHRAALALTSLLLFAGLVVGNWLIGRGTDTLVIGLSVAWMAVVFGHGVYRFVRPVPVFDIDAGDEAADGTPTYQRFEA